jgi:hypothetical protein
MEQKEKKTRKTTHTKFADHYMKSRSTRTRVTSANGCVYYKKYKEGQKKFRFTKTELANVRRILNEEILEEMLNGAVINLPYKLGWLYILKTKGFKMSATGDMIAPLDFNKTKEFGRKVYIDNTEFDGFSFKSKWFKKRKDHNSMFFFTFKLNKFSREKLKEKLKIKNFYKRYRDVTVYRP